MMDIKEDSKCGLWGFWQKTGMGAIASEEVAKELHKPVIKKFKRRKIFARFKIIFGHQI